MGGAALLVLLKHGESLNAFGGADERKEQRLELATAVEIIVLIFYKHILVNSVVSTQHWRVTRQISGEFLSRV